MNKEDKELLLKDLSARLPYGVMLKHISTENPFKLFSIKRDEYASYKKDGVELAMNGIYYDYYVNDTYHDIELYIKPYLRPLSSMTEEEAKEIAILHDIKIKDILSVKVTSDYIDVIVDDGVCSTYRRTIWFDEIVSSIKCFDFLNAYHFDYRGLITKGLALEAPEGMYNLNKLQRSPKLNKLQL